jgi:hypothetical protein
LTAATSEIAAPVRKREAGIPCGVGASQSTPAGNAGKALNALGHPASRMRRRVETSRGKDPAAPPSPQRMAPQGVLNAARVRRLKNTPRGTRFKRQPNQTFRASLKRVPLSRPGSPANPQAPRAVRPLDRRRPRRHAPLRLALRLKERACRRGRRRSKRNPPRHAGPRFRLRSSSFGGQAARP